jgi:hypothetical protein
MDRRERVVKLYEESGRNATKARDIYINNTDERIGVVTILKIWREEGYEIKGRIKSVKGNVYEGYREDVVSLHDECGGNASMAKRLFLERYGIEIDRSYVSKFWREAEKKPAEKWEHLKKRGNNGLDDRV